VDLALTAASGLLVLGYMWFVERNVNSAAKANETLGPDPLEQLQRFET
jgi:hypothetical protein